MINKKESGSDAAVIGRGCASIILLGLSYVFGYISLIQGFGLNPKSWAVIILCAVAQIIIYMIIGLMKD